MKPVYRLALCQLDTQTDRAENLKTACRLIDEAAEKGAAIAAFPELFNVIDAGAAEPEEIPGGETVSLMAEKARQHRMWIHCGSIREKDPNGGLPRNTTVLLNPEGEIAAKYSKLHMFDITLPDGGSSCESAEVQPGDHIELAETELGRFGFAICYDLRFPELFRLLALKGAQLIFMPAEFNIGTGKLHWEPLLRARAIENGCYIAAPAQIGTKTTASGPYTCYGGSMVIDPNGVVIARAGERTCVTVAEIDLNYVDEVRSRIPSLANRRRDLYQLNGL